MNELTDIWLDPAEAIAEHLIDKRAEAISPVLAEVPLLSIVIAAYKSKHAWSDYLLAKKVHQFYTAWERLERREREAIYRKFQKKPRAFTEKLLLILQQQEDLAKCKLLGVLTTEYLRGDLKRADYLDLIETTAHLSLRDLRQLQELLGFSLIFPQRKVGERYATVFAARGLVVTEVRLPAEQRTSDEQFYRLTKLGQTFAELVAETKVEKAL